MALSEVDLEHGGKRGTNRNGALVFNDPLEAYICLSNITQINQGRL